MYRFNLLHTDFTKLKKNIPDFTHTKKNTIYPSCFKRPPSLRFCLIQWLLYTGISVPATCLIPTMGINSLAPGKCEWNFRYLIFQVISVIDGWGISCELFALRWMSSNLTDDKSTLVQVMAWCHQATIHYPSQCWLSLSLWPTSRHHRYFSTLVLVHIYVYLFSWPNSRIPQCTCPISHNALCGTKMAHFWSKWCIVKYGTGALCDLWCCCFEYTGICN